MSDNAIKRSEFSSLNRVEEKDVDLKTIIQIIKQNYKLFIIIITASLISAICYIYTRTPVYCSEAIIQVSDEKTSNPLTMSGMMNFSSKNSQAAELEIILISSPYILGEVAKQLNFTISIAPKYNSFFAKKIAQFKGSKISAQVSSLEVPNSLLGKPLTLNMRNDQEFVLKDSNGNKILDGQVDRVVSGNYHSEPVTIKVTKLSGPIGSQFTVIKQPENDISSSLSSNLKIDPEGTTGVLKLSYTSTSPETAQTILQNILMVAIQKDMDKRYEEVSKLMEFMLKQEPQFRRGLESEELKFNQYGAKTGVFDLKSEDAVLMQSIGNTQEALEKLDFKKTELLQKVTPLHPIIIGIQEERNLLISKLDRLTKKLNELPMIGQKSINLQRNIRIRGEIYTSILKSIYQAEIAKVSTTSAVKLLSPASYPVSPVPINKRAILCGSIFLGFVLSLGTVFLRVVLSPTIDEPDEVEQALGIPVLGLLPFSEKQKRHNKRISRNKLHNKAFLLAEENSKDICIELMRGLRTAIQMAIIEKRDKIIAITSCSPSVGKSFITENFAFLMSELDKRVLVIDADIRLGRMQYSFGKLKEPGLSTYLEGHAKISEIVQTIIPGKLDFISTGLYPSKPSELLTKDAFGQLIQEAKEYYDVIIIDTPPVLAVADPLLILRHSKINLLVIGIGKDRIKEAERVKNILEKSGVVLSGIVMNNMKSHTTEYGYGEYSYHYAYDKKNT